MDCGNDTGVGVEGSFDDLGAKGCELLGGWGRSVACQGADCVDGLGCMIGGQVFYDGEALISGRGEDHNKLFGHCGRPEATSL